jgi:hypothetical protein
MNGQVYDPTGKVFVVPNKPKDWFVYPIQFTTLAQAPSATVNTPASRTFQIDSASDFYLQQLTYLTEVDATTAITVSTFVVPKILIQITDGGSSRNLFNASTPLYSVAGDGNHPHKLLHPRLFFRNSSVTIAIENYSTNTTYARVFINLEGFRIYQ